MMIATRLLKLRAEKGDVDIRVCIYAPKQDGRSWSCRYEIDWPEGKEIMTSWGVDSVQALLIALQMIGADIYTSTYHKSGKLMFEAPGKGYGFPVPNNIRDVLIGDDAIYGG